MSSPSPAYLAVDIRLLKRCGRDIPIDVFLRIAEGKYAHVFSRSTGIDYRRLGSYIAKGVTELFIRREDEALWREYTGRSMEQVLFDERSAPQQKVAALLNMTEQSLAEVFVASRLSGEAVEGAGQVVGDYVRLLAESPATLDMLLKLAAHGDDLYAHSVATSVFAILLARAMGRIPTDRIKVIGLGGLLHDIGWTQIEAGIQEKPGEPAEQESKEVREHPRVGLGILEGAPGLPEEVRYIVYQHHEQVGGGGYPNGLQGGAIHRPARLVAVADAFSALIAARPWRPPYSPEAALLALRKDARRFEPEIVEKLAKILAAGPASIAA